MRSRGHVTSLIFGAVVAALSGAGVALAESNANISSVVGTAIASALLPPTVNCGICLSYAILGPHFIKDFQAMKRNVFFEIAVGSALLVWINIIFIYLSAVLVFKFKQVSKFRLIRKVDESIWQNLPKLGNTPMSSHRLPFGVTQTTLSTANPVSIEIDGENTDDDGHSEASSIASGLEIKQRRPRNFLIDDATDISSPLARHDSMNA
jgi:hypothetical protein